jgi:hypothetical protein
MHHGVLSNSLIVILHCTVLPPYSLDFPSKLKVKDASNAVFWKETACYDMVRTVS